MACGATEGGMWCGGPGGWHVGLQRVACGVVGLVDGMWLQRVACGVVGLVDGMWGHRGWCGVVGLVDGMWGRRGWCVVWWAWWMACGAAEGGVWCGGPGGWHAVTDLHLLPLEEWDTWLGGVPTCMAQCETCVFC